MVVTVVMAVTIVMVSMSVDIDEAIIEKIETIVYYVVDVVGESADDDAVVVVAVAVVVSVVQIVEIVDVMAVVLMFDQGNNSLCLLKMTSVAYVIYVVLKIYHSLFISQNINYSMP